MRPVWKHSLSVCVKGRWVKGGLFVCVPRVRAGTQSKQASLHPPWGRVRRHTAQSNHRLNLTVTSVAKVCYEHKAHVQAHVCAHIHKSIFLQWHPKPKLSKHCHLTDEPCSVSESLPCSLFLFSLFHSFIRSLISPLQANSIWLMKKMQERWHH